MQPIDFEEVLSRIVEKDRRYDREAYVFLRQALDYCHKSILKGDKAKREQEGNHVRVTQLLDAIRQYALSQYGPMAMTVLEEWGVRKCEDFGDIVFNMVEHRLLSTTEKDTREEFAAGFDFREAFCAPFLPAARRQGEKAKEGEVTSK
jgi:uncharacterized repeat protein (TIGR04138 family)